MYQVATALLNPHLRYVSTLTRTSYRPGFQGARSADMQTDPNLANAYTFIHMHRNLPIAKGLLDCHARAIQDPANPGYLRRMAG